MLDLKDRTTARVIIAFLAILIIFAAIRLVAVPFMYHQDEYKFALIVDPTENLRGESWHPPFQEIILHYSGLLLGFDRLRIVPLVFSILNAILVFSILRRYFGLASAFGGLTVLTFSFWHILASTMVGVDGTIVPFFYLLAAYCFFRYEENVAKKYWFVLSVISATGGMLTRSEFVLFFPVLLIYQLYKKRKILPSMKILAVHFFATTIAVLLCLPLLKLIYPYFELGKIFNYGTSFQILNIIGRDYFHILFLFAQVLLYASPLLPVVVVFGIRNMNKKSVFFLSWIIVALIFYLFVVDVSHRALERYLMTIIYPMSILGGSLFQTTLNLDKKAWLKVFLLFLVGSLLLGFGLNLLTAKTVPLYPKTGYLEQVISGDLNFYIQFTGGNGPLGFQLTALSLVVMYALPLLLFSCGLLIRLHKFKLFCFVAFFAGMMAYNVMLSEEFLFSGINPNIQKVAKESANYVLNDQNITRVITYNDIAAYELMEGGKYFARFYAVPEYFEKNLEKFNSFNESKFLIVDFPHINREGPYWQYLEKCQVLKTFEDKGVVLGYIFDCSQPVIKEALLIV